MRACGAQMHVCMCLYAWGDGIVRPLSIGAGGKLRPCLIRPPGECEFDAELGRLDHEQKAGIGPSQEQ